MCAVSRPAISEPVPVPETVVSEVISFREEAGIVRIVLGNEQDVFMGGRDTPREIVVTHRLVIAADDFRAMLLKVLTESHGNSTRLAEFTARLVN